MRHVSIAGDTWLSPTLGGIDLRTVVGQPEIFVFNLECAVPAGPKRTARRALLPCDAARLHDLKLGRTNIAVLANNHTHDFGTEGLLATIDAARQAQFQVLGAGRNLEEARRPVIAAAGGQQIGFLAYGDVRPHVACVAATESSPGVAPLVPDTVVEDITDLARNVDFVCVILHWGKEYIRYPEPEQRHWARLFADAGAGVIIGIHPHVLRGCEMARNAPVYYSIGNFIFPPVPLADGQTLRWDQQNNRGMLMHCSFDGSWNWDFEPYLIAPTGLPYRSPGDERVREQVVAVSAPLDSIYERQYPSLHRRERILRIIRKLAGMSWSERARLGLRLFRRPEWAAPPQY